MAPVGIGVRQKLLPRAGALDPEVGAGDHQRAGQIALHRELPVLRVADAEIRVDGEGVGRDRRATALKPFARVSGLSGVFCTLRLFESGDCCSHPAARCGCRPTCRSRCRSRRGRPATKPGSGCQAKPMRGWKPCLVGSHERVGIALAGQRAGGIVADHRRHGRESGHDVEVHQAAVAFGDAASRTPSARRR